MSHRTTESLHCADGYPHPRNPGYPNFQVAKKKLYYEAALPVTVLATMSLTWKLRALTPLLWVVRPQQPWPQTLRRLTLGAAVA